MEFIYFKSVVGITLVCAILIAFINLISIENAEIILFEKINNMRKN